MGLASVSVAASSAGDWAPEHRPGQTAIVTAEKLVDLSRDVDDPLRRQAAEEFVRAHRPEVKRAVGRIVSGPDSPVRDAALDLAVRLRLYEDDMPIRVSDGLLLRRFDDVDFELPSEFLPAVQPLAPDRIWLLASPIEQELGPQAQLDPLAHWKAFLVPCVGEGVCPSLAALEEIDCRLETPASGLRSVGEYSQEWYVMAYGGSLFARESDRLGLPRKRVLPQPAMVRPGDDADVTPSSTEEQRLR